MANIVVTSAGHPTTAVSTNLYIRINGKKKNNIIIESFDQYTGVRPDELVFGVFKNDEILAPAATTSKVTAQVLNVVGSKDGTLGPMTDAYTGLYDRHTLVELYDGGSRIWTGFIAARIVDPRIDYVTYTAMDVRYLMRDTIAGVLAEIKVAEDTVSTTAGTTVGYSEERRVFNKGSLPNRSSGGMFFTQNDNEGTFWNGPDIVDCLVRLRDKQAEARGLDGSGTEAGHAPGWYLINMNFADLDKADLTPIPEPSEALKGGDFDNFDPIGMTFAEAIENVLSSMGLTMSTDMNGRIRAVPVAPSAKRGSKRPPAASSVPPTVITDWSQSYGIGVNSPLPTGIEGDYELIPAWSEAEEIEVIREYFSLRGYPPSIYTGYAYQQALAVAAGATLDELGLLKILDNHPRVWSAYRVPLGTLPLEQLAHLNEEGNLPLETIMMFFKLPGAANYVAHPLEQTGFQVDPIKNMIYLPSMRYSLLTFLFDQSAQSFTASSIRMIMCQSAYRGYNKRTIAAATSEKGATYSLPNIQTNVRVSDTFDKYASDYKQLPPMIPVSNISTKRRLKTGGNSLNFYADEDVGTSKSTWTANKTTKVRSTTEDTEASTLDIAAANERAAARILQAHKPRETGQMVLPVYCLSIRCGDQVAYSLATQTGTQDEVRMIVSHVSHKFAGRAGADLDTFSNVPICTELDLG